MPELTALHDVILGVSYLGRTRAIDRIVLRRAIEELPAGCRKIFVLHTVHGYQHHEIAQLLRCSVGTSKSQLHKAKVKMRNFLFQGHRGVPRSADGVSTPAETKA